MAEITNRTKRLVAELTVLVCIICVWIVRSETFDIDDVKAGVLKQVVKADSDNTDAYRFLAGYYMDLGSYEKAVEALREVVKIEPDDANAHSMLGDACWNCGRYEEAINHLTKAMEFAKHSLTEIDGYSNVAKIEKSLKFAKMALKRQKDREY